MQAHPDKMLKPRQLRRWRMPCGSDPANYGPTCGLFLQMKFHLDTATLAQLCIIYGQVHVTTTELSSCDRLKGLQTLKYLLLGPSEKKTATPGYMWLTEIPTQIHEDLNK